MIQACSGASLWENRVGTVIKSRSSEQRRSLSDDLLEAIHLLLRILASANVNQSVIDKMKSFYIIPTQNGKLCSSNDNVYIVDETIANTLQGSFALKRVLGTENQNQLTWG